MGEVVPRCGAGSLMKIRPGEYESRSHGRASSHVESASSP
jgi:hypothetical protein